MGDWPNKSRLSALTSVQACEDVLRRLQTDHIDLYQMHHIDRDTPWDEIWQAMDLLVQQGKIIYVGIVELRRLAHRAAPTRPRARGTRSGWCPSRASTT